MMNHMPTLAHILTPFPYTIDSQSSIDDAIAIMQEKAIRHLVVTGEGDFIGLLSERDLQQHDIFGRHSDNLTVDDICTHNVVVADIHDPLDRVLDAMAEKQLGSVVVLKNGELTGILTTIDVCKHFSQFLKEQFPDPPPDIYA
ncbi:hypothetical protein R50073_36390 [Maricurvus nonylphenolicus]|uniref:CBS domain-containing protein n=1 Tax=Maricurvus nonylphenolicus TaxID=1008307 RepID=UPI0036F3570A